MLIVPMIGVLIMHDVLQNYVTMKVIVITTLVSLRHLLPDAPIAQQFFTLTF